MTKIHYVILVDENDNPIGIEEKQRAHEQGLLHRAFSVFIFNNSGDTRELLIQQRNLNKYHCPGLWTNTCCSHPEPGETIPQAAHRRLQEEMNLTVDHLSIAGTFHYRAEVNNNSHGLIEHEIDHVLVGETQERNITVNPHEVAAYRWEKPEALLQSIDQNPHLYTPWFAQSLKIALKQ